MPVKSIPGIGHVVTQNEVRALLGSPRVFNVEQAPYNASVHADPTAAIQQAATDIAALGGGVVYLPKVYEITAPINPADRTTFHGGGVGGGGLRAKAGAGIIGGLISMDGKTAVVVQMLEIDGNADAGGNNAYGIYAKNGAQCAYRGCYIHDTTNAGISDLDQWYTEVSGNQLSNCGRIGVTDNHGLMLGAITARGSKGARVFGNTIVGAFRKGLTVFAFNPGTTRDVSVTVNTVMGCGLGGIYLGGDVDGICSSFTVSANPCSSNYTNIFAAHLSNSTITGNPCNGTLFDCNVHLQNCQNMTVVGNPLANAQSYTIRLFNCAAVSVTENPCVNGNQGANANTAGIDLNGCTGCIVKHNSVLDTTGKQQFGILEEGASDFNIIGDNVVSGATVARYFTTGASTIAEETSGRNRGVNAIAPSNTLEIGGGLSVREQQLTNNGAALVNGNNNNIVLPIGAGTLFASGPTAAFAITGIAGGSNGRELWIYNLSGVTMTIAHNSAASGAGNKILNSTGADLVIPTFGAVRLTYSLAVPNAWIVTGKA